MPSFLNARCAVSRGSLESRERARRRAALVRPARLTAIALAVALAAMACGGGSGTGDAPKILASPSGISLRISRVVAADVPAAFAFSPACEGTCGGSDPHSDGRLWYGELTSGRIFSLGKQRWDFAVSAGGESGLESITISRDGRYLVAYISVPKGDPADTAQDGGEASVSRVVRLSIADDGGLADPVTLLEVPSTGIHNAGSVGFGPDSLLYVDIGDNHDFGESQSLASPFGKILRITTDGAPAPGNPFAGRSDADPRVWAYGIRNTFAFDWTASGAMLGADDGDTGNDAINRLVAGANYGWPPLDSGPRAGEVVPVRVFQQTIAPSGLAVVPDGFGEWSSGNHAFVCGYVSRKMTLVALDDASPPATDIIDGCSLRVVAAPGHGSIFFSNEKGIWHVEAVPQQ